MDHRAIKQQFLEAFDSYSNGIFRFCFMKTSDRELAEDLTQETFVRFWQSLKKGKEMPNTRSFLFTIAQNLVIDWYRKKKATSLDRLGENGFEAREERAPSGEREAEYTEMWQVIQALDEEDRTVLVLRYIEGLEPREIADILHLSANTASVRIHRAIKKAQKLLRHEK